MLFIQMKHLSDMARMFLAPLMLSMLLISSLTLTAAAPVATFSSKPAGPPGASGSLTGSANLQGTNGNPINLADSAVVSNYQLVAGQSQESDNGLYLDFTSTPNPQPLRGTGGGTDPGPRMTRFPPFSLTKYCS